MSTNHHDRRVEHHRVERQNAFGRGFMVGFVSCAILVAAFMYGQREAYANERPSPRAHVTKHTALPPHWRTWILVAKCEMPAWAVPGYYEGRNVDPRVKRRNAWMGIAWNQTYSMKFPGGMGFTQLNWTTFRPRSARHIPLMSQATPVQQLWAAERIWRWANVEYPGNGYTAWECAENIGWTTHDPDDALRLWK